MLWCARPLIYLWWSRGIDAQSTGGHHTSRLRSNAGRATAGRHHHSHGMPPILSSLTPLQNPTRRLLHESHGWTAERRATQASAIKNWRPWERSTGRRLRSLRHPPVILPNGNRNRRRPRRRRSASDGQTANLTLLATVVAFILVRTRSSRAHRQALATSSHEIPPGETAARATASFGLSRPALLWYLEKTMTAATPQGG